MVPQATGITDHVEQIAARIPAWHGAQDIQFERIGGLTNANYRVTVNGERFVLRVSGPNAAHLGIDRSAELTALNAAAAAGIGPEIVAYLLPEGHLVTRWVEGRHWDPREFRTPANVHLLTETVRRIHALPPNGATFSPFERATRYLVTAREYAVPFPLGLDGILETMHAVQAEQQSDPSDWQRFCHNDLVCVNYLVSDREPRIVVLDWEFAGLNDLYYDLATVVYTHDSEGPIPQELEDEMLACYFGEATAWRRRRLLGMKCMLILFTAAWGLAQHGMQQAGMIPAVEGFDYLEFAQFLLAHDVRELQRHLDRGSVRRP